MKRKFLCLVSISLMWPVWAWCGTGAYIVNTSRPDELHLKVNLEFQGSDPAEWHALFQEASKLLYDATERQVLLSQVTFYKNCDEVKDQVDVRIGVGLGNAHTFPAGLGYEGYAIYLTQLHKEVNASDARGQFGLVHELGHYAFGLLDEYLDEDGVSASSCVVSPAETPASIMDGGTTVATKNRRTEFCTAATHNRGRTQQDTERKIGGLSFRNADSWTFLAAFVKDRYHATLVRPLSPEPSIEGFGNGPVFLDGICALDAVVGVDNSGSMSGSAIARVQDTAGGLQPALALPGGGAIEAVKAGANTFIRLLQEKDSAALVDLGGQVGVLSLRKMDIDRKFKLLSEIPRVRAAGSAGWTKLLKASFQQIGGEAGDDNGAAPAGNRAIVLFSDGLQESEKIEPEVFKSLIPAVKRRGAVVYAVGVANGDAADLRRATAETGGKFHFARTAAEVDAAAMTILAETKSRGIIDAREGKLAAGERIDIRLPVDSATQEAEFLLTWNGQHERSLEMQVKDAQDLVVESDQKNRVVLMDFDQKMKRYWVKEPAAGEWVVSITNPDSKPRDFAFQVHSSAPKVTLAAHAENGEVATSEPLILKAAVATDRPVSGATVVAEIERPDGKRLSVPLFDDGLLEHGDERANDGAYSNQFEDYGGSGSYNVEVSVDSEGGKTVCPDEENADACFPEKVERFVRKARFSVVVRETRQGKREDGKRPAR